MNWEKVTFSFEVIKLLKKREEIEKKIFEIDDRALINYELEKLNE